MKGRAQAVGLLVFMLCLLIAWPCQAVPLNKNSPWGKLIKQGSLAYGNDDYDLATALFQRAYQLSSNVLERAKSLDKMGILYVRTKRYALAERCFTESLKLKEPCLGPNHLEVAGVLLELGHCSMFQDHYAPAKRYYERTLAILERHYGRHSRYLRMTLHHLAYAYDCLELFDLCESTLRRQAAILEDMVGPEGYEVAGAVYRLGELLLKMERYSEAALNFLRAARIWRATSKRNFDDARAAVKHGVLCYKRAGFSALEQKKDAVADRMFHLAAHYVEGLEDEEELWEDIGDWLMEHGDYARAEDALRRLLKVMQRTHASKDRQVRKALRDLSKCIAERRRSDK